MDPSQHQPGKVVHTVGWPLDFGPGGTLGGSYLYHLENNQVAIGLIVDLGYKNPHLSPFDEFQRFQAPQADPSDIAGRQADRLWRARGGQRRLPSAA